MEIQGRKNVIVCILEVEHCSGARLGLGSKPAEIKHAAIQPVVDENSIGCFKIMPVYKSNGCK